MLVDVGANLAAEDFDKDLAAVLERARQAQISQIVITGSSYSSNAAAAQICQQHDAQGGFLFSTVGLHPHEAKAWNTDLAQKFQQQLQHPRVVAVGECGLDFNRDFSPRPLQEKAFEGQLQLAATTDLPVFLHERDASERMLAILREYRHCFKNAIVHCFTGEKQALYAYLDLDLHIGITGWICDERRGLHLHKLVKDIPVGRLMLETDSPYLLPRSMQPKPRSRRNEPAFLPEVVKVVAQCRQETPGSLAQHTSACAKAFFNI